MARQPYVVRGLRKKPFSVASGIRAQASQLPGLYSLRQQRDYQDKQVEIGEANLQMGREKMAIQKKQFGKQMDAERDAQNVAVGGMLLKGGMSAAKLGYDSGVFDKRISEIKGKFIYGRSWWWIRPQCK
jgi:hypothetical protein